MPARQTNVKAEPGKAALYYARVFGWRVFPLHNPEHNGRCSCRKPDCTNLGKHPRTAHGLKEATLDLAQIEAWWQESPEANIGVVAGPESGFWVLDIDPRSGGDDALQELRNEHGELPTGVVALTGGGGFHFLYKWPEGIEKIRSRGLKKPDGTMLGIDVKGNGGYIVVAPSLHASGRFYSWEASGRPDENALTDAPAWLLQLVLEKKKSATAKPATPARHPDAAPLAPKTVPESFLGIAFAHASWLGQPTGSENQYTARCPWIEEHSNYAGGWDHGDTSTVLFPPSEGKTLGFFHCSHGHCGARSVEDVLAILPAEAKAAAHKAFPAPKPDGTSYDFVQTEPGFEWTETLENDKKGRPLKTPSNCHKILQNDPRWQKIIAWDAFRCRCVKLAPPPWPSEVMPSNPEDLLGAWTGDDDLRMQCWLDQHYHLQLDVNPVADSVRIVSHTREFHPVRDYLTALEWDGTHRINRWLVYYLGAEDTPYVRSVGLWWIISAIARVMQPGCKVDHMLVLEGKQGLFKSTALRKLFSSDWFTDHISGELGSKDSYIALNGRWGIEIAELDSLLRTETSRAKAFMSQPIDQYRPPWGRKNEDVPRQCVFAGTVNHDDYLRDDTGNRRFWPVKCGVVQPIDIDGIERDRDQIWAEALTEYRDGRHWWPTQESVPVLNEEQDQRFQTDAWELPIREWLAPKADPITAADILGGALGLDRAKWDRGAQTRVGVALRRLGWTKRRVSLKDGGRTFVYDPPAGGTSSVRAEIAGAGEGRQPGWYADDDR